MDKLRKEDYGIPVGKILRGVARSSRSNEYYEYTYTYEFCDSNRMRLRRGDIFEFSDSYKLPKYVRGQHGVVLERYRKVKFKYKTFKDYCAVVMIITGDSKGKILRIASTKLSCLEECVLWIGDIVMNVVQNY